MFSRLLVSPDPVLSSLPSHSTSSGLAADDGRGGGVPIHPAKPKQVLPSIQKPPQPAFSPRSAQGQVKLTAQPLPDKPAKTGDRPRFAGPGDRPWPVTVQPPFPVRLNALFQSQDSPARESDLRTPGYRDLPSRSKVTEAELHNTAAGKREGREGGEGKRTTEGTCSPPHPLIPAPSRKRICPPAQPSPRFLLTSILTERNSAPMDRGKGQTAVRSKETNSPGTSGERDGGRNYCRARGGGRGAK